MDLRLFILTYSAWEPVQFRGHHYNNPWSQICYTSTTTLWCCSASAKRDYFTEEKVAEEDEKQNRSLKKNDKRFVARKVSG